MTAAKNSHFKKFYKCRWCGNIFPQNKTFDANKDPLYCGVPLFHNCQVDMKMKGISDQVGVLYIDDDRASESQ